MFEGAINTDASHAVFNDVGRDQYNIVYNGQDVLEQLEVVRMDASTRMECLPNTRKEVLTFIRDWVNNPSHQQRILWVHGLPGSGKSTISTTIASNFRSEDRLGAFLFFDRHAVERTDPTIVIRTLAHQMAGFDAKLRTEISSAIQNNPNIRLSPFIHQFQKLIIDPLLTIEPASSLIVIVIDALDECGTPKTREVLLSVLAEQSSKLPSAVRIIITSRTESDISAAFKSREHILSHKLDTTSQVNTNDIMTYFRHRMSQLRNNKPDVCTDPDWPGEDMLCRLVQHASGLFVWASTASEFLNGYDPNKRLRLILGEDSAPRAGITLDNLYITALESISLWDDEDFVEDFRVIMEVVLIAQQPLTVTSIDALLPNRRPSSYTISLLACVLQQNPAVRVLHSSFVDFLMSKDRCQRDAWFFDRSACHGSLAVLCLNRLDEVLKQNMCQLTLSASFTVEPLPEDIRYACVFWVDHVCAIVQNPTSIAEHLCDFLYLHLMHWFEAMSILGKSRDTISLLDRLLRWTSIHSKNQTKLCELVRDACHFARVFSSSIEEHPLFVYMVALPFAPTHTHLYRTFHDASFNPSVAGGFQKSWSPGLLVLNGHEKEVLSVAFSPDGTRIVSGSSDHTIRIWDSASGAEVPPRMQHHSKVGCVLFSPDGNRIVSGSHDTTVRIWDATSGALALPVLRGHKRAVLSVAYSSDGARIVSGSEDRTIRVWDTSSGAQVLELRGHRDDVMSVAMTRDGTRIVSGSHDNTIRIWDASSGDPISSPLRKHGDWVLSVALSPDGTRIASGSEDRTIRVWNATTSARILALRGHRNRVQQVIFSPDGTHLASCSDDKTIRVWDANTGIQIRPALISHTSWVQSVAFSGDGSRLVSGSGDKTVRIWDATLDVEASEQRPSHDYSVSSVAFSLDGQRIASGSFDKTIRIWDTASGAQVHPPLRGHHGAIFSIAFSPEGTCIVSSSEDKTIRVWNVVTGEQVFTELRRRDDLVLSCAFSLDGNRVMSGSKEGKIQMWDASSGAKIVSAPEEEGRQPGKSDILEESAVVSDPNDKLIKASDAAFTWTDHYSHSPSSTISIVKDGWIMDLTTNEKISKLPPLFNVKCGAICNRSLVVGTSNGQVLVMHFPVQPCMHTLGPNGVVGP